jgi:hypothetical protein
MELADGINVALEEPSSGARKWLLRRLNIPK